MYDIAELLLAVATQNNIMRTENRTWLWFESQYAGNVEALVAVGWKCSLSQTWHASGARLQCVFMAGGRMVVANYCSVCGDLGKVIFLFFFCILDIVIGRWGGLRGWNRCERNKSIRRPLDSVEHSVLLFVGSRRDYSAILSASKDNSVHRFWKLS